MEVNICILDIRQTIPWSCAPGKKDERTHEQKFFHCSSSSGNNFMIKMWDISELIIASVSSLLSFSLKH